MKESILRDKSFAFAIRIVNFNKFLKSEKKEYTLSKQILRCGCSIGAMVREAEHAQSNADFKNKMSIALKEANETEYWLELLYKTSFLDEKEYLSLQTDCGELIATVRTMNMKTAKRQ